MFANVITILKSGGLRKRKISKVKLPGLADDVFTRLNISATHGTWDLGG